LFKRIFSPIRFFAECIIRAQVTSATAIARSAEESPTAGRRACRRTVKPRTTHFSFDDLVRDKKTVWSGVKNALAQKHLRSVKIERMAKD
jgi:hypothetical protein